MNRISLSRVASLLKLDQKYVEETLQLNYKFTESEEDTIIRKGFDGLSLNRLMIWYICDSCTVTMITKAECRKIYLEWGSRGIQSFVDSFSEKETK
jgi:hypothetical protein